ncbi:hypothetical protein [Planctomicrobium piriforme]|uniref:Uncharacterized protein n=1 Tax=Planctomicrobium piriforme TaxID=1576369 RepID=A0A1I3IIS9_9PLAN|nr:hypothetical protein [Planctomicrobium piriforme]SFI47894.1 hypothetical protein SAMN05421753_109144 [Planctomicrobium piriforme]
MLTAVRHSLIWSACALGVFSAASLQAQDRHLPLDHRAPTGVAGRWSALTKPGIAGAPQPVRFTLPGAGVVSFYSGSPHHPVPFAAPAQAGLGVGYVYRIRISDMPDYPGIELFPTVELIDRLHPPAGLEQEFPIPVQITAEDIETVLQDRMVTKVIYLEQPDLAAPVEQTEGARIENLPPVVNLLQAADLRGRPMAIIRMGGRIPDPRGTTDEFFSSSPLQLQHP